MDRTSEKLTVFFEEPFYVGIFERVSDGKLYVFIALRPSGILSRRA